MGEILFLSHRIPFPPDRGDKIRSHHVLARIARIAPVHVATFAEDDFDSAEERPLADLAASHRLVKRNKPLPLAGLEALASGKPVSLTAFYDSKLAQYVGEVLATRPISAIYVFSGQMGQYVPADFAGRVVVDFVDADSAKFEAYGQKKRGPRGWIDAREGRLLCGEEARLVRRANVSLLISKGERDLFVSRLPVDLRETASIEVMPNGMDSDLFAPGAGLADPALQAIAGPKLIFTGQMDYAPNIEAALRAIEAIMPLVRRAVPDATFHVVGRNPPASLLKWHQVNGNFVWGRVADMRQWLAGSQIALVPLDIARGVQNKVLEAMAMALPVVLTPGAATGIDARDGADFQIAESDGDLAGAVIDLLINPDRAAAMGQAARAFITANTDWDAALARLPQWLGIVPSVMHDAA
jgi:sugar transferase (PEP-CTERM/EpsH1 system associated)